MDKHLGNIIYTIKADDTQFKRALSTLKVQKPVVNVSVVVNDAAIRELKSSLATIKPPAIKLDVDISGAQRNISIVKSQLDALRATATSLSSNIAMRVQHSMVAQQMQSRVGTGGFGIAGPGSMGIGSPISNVYNQNRSSSFWAVAGGIGLGSFLRRANNTDTGVSADTHTYERAVDPIVRVSNPVPAVRSAGRVPAVPSIFTLSHRSFADIVDPIPAGYRPEPAYQAARRRTGVYMPKNTAEDIPVTHAPAVPAKSEPDWGAIRNERKKRQAQEAAKAPATPITRATIDKSERTFDKVVKDIKIEDRKTKLVVDDLFSRAGFPLLPTRSGPSSGSTVRGRVPKVTVPHILTADEIARITGEGSGPGGSPVSLGGVERALERSTGMGNRGVASSIFSSIGSASTAAKVAGGIALAPVALAVEAIKATVDETKRLEANFSKLNDATVALSKEQVQAKIRIKDLSTESSLTRQGAWRNTASDRAAVVKSDIAVMQEQLALTEKNRAGALVQLEGAKAEAKRLGVGKDWNVRNALFGSANPTINDNEDLAQSLSVSEAWNRTVVGILGSPNAEDAAHMLEVTEKNYAYQTKIYFELKKQLETKKELLTKEQQEAIAQEKKVAILEALNAFEAQQKSDVLRHAQAQIGFLDTVPQYMQTGGMISEKFGKQKAKNALEIEGEYQQRIAAANMQAFRDNSPEGIDMAGRMTIAAGENRKTQLKDMERMAKLAEFLAQSEQKAYEIRTAGAAVSTSFQGNKALTLLSDENRELQFQIDNYGAMTTEKQKQLDLMKNEMSYASQIADENQRILDITNEIAVADAKRDTATRSRLSTERDFAGERIKALERVRDKRAELINKMNSGGGPFIIAPGADEGTYSAVRDGKVLYGPGAETADIARNSAWGIGLTPEQRDMINGNRVRERDAAAGLYGGEYIGLNLPGAASAPQDYQRLLDEAQNPRYPTHTGTLSPMWTPTSTPQQDLKDLQGVLEDIRDNTAKQVESSYD
jgi:hypothetical protein